MQILMLLLILGLVVLALAVSFTRRLLPAVIIYMSYSLVSSVIWMLLQSPDLAITEAAVGAGVSTVMFIVAFKRMGLFEEALREEKSKASAIEPSASGRYSDSSAPELGSDSSAPEPDSESKPDSESEFQPESESEPESEFQPEPSTEEVSHEE